MTTQTPMAPVVPSRGALTPVGLNEVALTGGFWADRQAVVGRATIPHALAWEERIGWFANFTRALTDDPERAGLWFADSDVYKLMEAMAWEIARTGDAGLEARLDELTALIAPVQKPDGYVNTHFDSAGQPDRYTDFPWGHELYTYGHLFQAAIARLRSGHHDAFVDIALRAADHVCATFGEDGLPAVCGHPEVETALVELGRATGRRKYIDQAKRFIDRRGHGWLGEPHLGPAYFVDDIPVRDMTAFRGHAVRAGYLAAGAVDVAVETGDDALLAAVKAQYDATIARRAYLTGGLGSRQVGEAMGEDFELPPDLAYAETCAAIASVMVAWRLLLATGEEHYADIIERTLYNAIAVCPSEAGDAFFYANPLHQRVAGGPADPDAVSERADTAVRAPWFTVSCCPTNIARTYASLSGLFVTVTDDEVRLHQYAPTDITTHLADGRPVALRVTTDYPAGGDIAVEVVTAPAGAWTLALRIPAWATPTLNGLEREGDLAVVRGAIPAGTRVGLRLDVTPRFTHPDPRIDAVRGCVAVERGPLVCCLESVDLPDGVDIADVVLDTTVPPVAHGDGAAVRVRPRTPGERSWPYVAEAPAPPVGAGMTVPLVPYHRWGNRAPSAMRVWLPTVG